MTSAFRGPARCRPPNASACLELELQAAVASHELDQHEPRDLQLRVRPGLLQLELRRLALLAVVVGLPLELAFDGLQLERLVEVAERVRLPVDTPVVAALVLGRLDD